MTVPSSFPAAGVVAATRRHRRRWPATCARELAPPVDEAQQAIVESGWAMGGVA